MTPFLLLRQRTLGAFQVASLGDIGYDFAVTVPEDCASTFGRNNYPTTGNDITATSDVPSAFVSLIRNGVVNGRSRADDTGAWHFYDFDNSGSQVYAISAYTQSGPTGELWTATVTGSTVVVTKLFGSQRAQAAAFA